MDKNLLYLLVDLHNFWGVVHKASGDLRDAFEVFIQSELNSIKGPISAAQSPVKEETQPVELFPDAISNRSEKNKAPGLQEELPIYHPRHRGSNVKNGYVGLSNIASYYGVSGWTLLAAIKQAKIERFSWNKSTLLKISDLPRIHRLIYDNHLIVSTK